MEVCSKCSKAVYPVEKMSFLEQIWHKRCFTCTTCECVLTLRNVKGYDRKPYCSTHYPRLVSTSLATDPVIELAKQTQSNVSNIGYKQYGSIPVGSDKRERLRKLGSLEAEQSDEAKVRSRVKSFNVQQETTIKESDTSKRLPRRKSSLSAEEESMSDPKYHCINKFTKTEDDEMDASVEDLIFVEKVFDDGWALGLNAKTGVKGLIPFNSLEKA